MRSYKDLNKEEQESVKMDILNKNTITACLGLQGFTVSKLTPSKENRKKFQQEFKTDYLCGCVGCMEMAKIFIDKSEDMREEVIYESTRELEAFRIK